MYQYTRVFCVLISTLYLCAPAVISAQTASETSAEVHSTAQHDRHSDEDEHGDGTISLTEAQISTAGIVVAPLMLTTLNTVINAPGLVAFNNYKTISITPRITAQLIKRHVALGDTVKQGQVIVTLSSVEMAEAQGHLLLAHKEWVRAKQLGKKIISDKRFTQIRVEWQLAQAKAKAYGMTEQQINRFVKTEDFTQADGHFDLTSLIDGTVVKEAFVKGEQVDSGQEINLITDESRLWVLASVSPSVAKQVVLNNNATVSVNNHRYPATVAQISHSLDETTRTNTIRLDVNNDHDELHSGLFVDTQIEVLTGENTVGLSLPDSAVVRSSDGDWQVMVEQDHAGEFKGVEVDLIRVMNGIAVIEGLAEGTRVVTQGAFFVQSELAKNNFEVHNH